MTKSAFSFLKVLCLASCVLFLYNCKKDVLNTDHSVKLKFSTDSILYDTVFTTIGSTTKMLKVYNTNSKKIKISSIRLAGGSNSLFSLNINGKYATSANDVEIAGKDSIFIFIKVTVNPNNLNIPVIVADSILFNTNGNEQQVKLVACGQDVHFIVPDTYVKGLPPYKIIAKEHSSITWNNDKPYVIYGYAVIDSTGSLTINEGVRIYFYNSSGMWVYKGGNIQVNGSLKNPVTFQGTRLEADYKNIPGQWDRIWINEGSTNNVINYAVIKNSFIGIQAETLDQSLAVSKNNLTLTNTTILNCSGYGLLARDYKINGANCLITNCGQYGIALTRGGSYDFRNCTVGNFWNNDLRQTPSVVLNNYITDANGKVVSVKSLDNAYFGNCILYGNIDDEILLDSNKTGTFKYDFDHCLLKTTLKTKSSHFQNPLVNKDPMFLDFTVNNYHLDKTSPAAGIGLPSILNSNPALSPNLAYDLDGTLRNIGSIDLGAYQIK